MTLFIAYLCIAFNAVAVPYFFWRWMTVKEQLQRSLAINKSYEEHCWSVVREIIMHHLGDTPITDCTIINSQRTGTLIFIGDGDKMTRLDVEQMKSKGKHLTEVADEAFNRWSQGEYDESF